MRKDLNMRKGKIAAQAAHASLSAILKAYILDNNCRSFWLDGEDHVQVSGECILGTWMSNSYRKICLYVNSEAELLDIYQEGLAREYKISLVQDNGLTEFHNIPTYTCLAFEPLYDEDIDKITGHLPLL